MQVEAIKGAGYFLRGIRLIGCPGIRRYVAMPLLINAVLFGGLIYFGASQFGLFLDWLLPDWIDWLQWILWPIFVVTCLLIVFFGFALVANLVAAPFNGLLAEAVERSLTDMNFVSDLSGTRFAKELWRGVGSEVRKLMYALVRAIPALLLFLIPGVNVIAPFIWMAFSAWMLAVEYADYPMANHGIAFPEQRKLLSDRRLLSLGFGGAVMLALIVPLLNLLVIPAAVAGATAMWVEQLGPHKAGGTPNRLES